MSLEEREASLKKTKEKREKKIKIAYTLDQGR